MQESVLEQAPPIQKRPYGVGRKFKRGKVWWVAVYDGRGNERRESCYSRNEREADEKLKKLLAERPSDDIVPVDPEPPQVTKQPRRVFVYFLKPVGIERVKIGFTTREVKARMNLLSVGCPAPLECLLVLSCESSATERVIHEFLDRYRVEGRTEWFHLKEPVVQFIECLRRLNDAREGENAQQTRTFASA
jgi:hypothetical protein